MDTSINVKWNGKMAFETSLQGHRLLMDAGAENGGNDLGPRPKSLILSSLAGCTGMDVVSLLAKMRVEVAGFELIVEADLEKDHPKYYNRIHVIYQFEGENLPYEKLQKAVDMSFEKYCGVIGLLKKAIPVTSEIRLVK